MDGPLSPILNSLRNIFKPSNISDRLNLPAQIGAVLKMNPQQATNYRQQVNQVLPKIPVTPPATLPTPQVNTPYYNNLNRLNPVQPMAAKTVSSLVNPLQTGAEGLARLPAARTVGQGATDIGDLIAGILQGAALLHGARILGTTAVQNPQWINNQMGSVQIPPIRQKMTIEQMAERAGGWQPGDRAKFDTALLNNDVKTVKEMLNSNRIPEEYMTRGFGPEIYRRLLNAARPEPVYPGVTDAGELLSRYSDQIVKPSMASKALNWFYR